MKLHLGCGQVYLEGYTNIDYPPSKHTLQEKSVADKLIDLHELKFSPQSVEEVRNHHVFEHFPRHIALALFCAWTIWLKKGGKIHIEVPDFDESTRLIFSSKASMRDKGVALRHVFGSNEAEWAVHYDGWTKDRLKEIAKLFGLKNIRIEQSSYLATRNITLTAKKGIRTISQNQAVEIARKYLINYTVDDSASEQKLLNIWLEDFKIQLNKSVSHEE